MSPETIEGLVADYGYGIVLVGTYFDHYGIPLFLVFGGIAASKDLLNVYGVLLSGFAGGWIADLFLYFLGYKTGLAYWMRFSWVRRMESAISATHRMFQTRPAVVVILGRFLPAGARPDHGQHGREGKYPVGPVQHEASLCVTCRVRGEKVRFWTALVKRGRAGNCSRATT